MVNYKELKKSSDAALYVYKKTYTQGIHFVATKRETMINLVFLNEWEHTQNYVTQHPLAFQLEKKNKFDNKTYGIVLQLRNEFNLIISERIIY